MIFSEYKQEKLFEKEFYNIYRNLGIKVNDKKSSLLIFFIS